MKVTCISKNRNDKGVIVNYTLRDEQGHVFTATAESIKKEMKLNRYEFTNLQIDSIGRLVDKVNKEEIKQSVNGRDIYSEFEKAYCKLLSNQEVEFGCIDFGNNFENFGYNHKIYELVDSNEKLRDAYMTGIISKFEEYLLQYGTRVPYKLQIRSKDGVFEKVIYSLSNIETSLSDYIKEDLGNKAYYRTDKNYMVRAYKIDTPNQLIRGIYIATDMSAIAIKEVNQQKSMVNNETKQTEQVKTNNTSNNKTMGTLDYIGKFITGFFKHKARRQSRKFIIGRVFDIIFGR